MESGELAAQQNEQLLALNPSLSSSQLSMFNTQLLPLHFQEELERQCWLQGGRRQTAPAQRMLDFTRKKLSYDLPESSYSPGLISSPLHFWMPEFISKRLSLGFQQFGRSSHGFLTNEAVMIGVETRTSTRNRSRTIPLRRGCGLCRRNRFCRSRRRTVCGSSSQLSESIIRTIEKNELQT